MSVVGVHRLAPPLLPLSLPTPPHASLSITANQSVVHRLASHHKRPDDAEAESESEPSVGEGETLDKNVTRRKNPFVSEDTSSRLLFNNMRLLVYYSTAFLLVWFYVAPAPGKMGYLAAAERFVKVMAMVWAGSQVTKLVRIGGAVALAPIVDRGLSWFTVKYKFESQGKAFGAMVGICLGLALMLFLVVTLLWA
ncbi:hypothetical protein Bca101_002167 [Brassica carinata]